MSKIGKKPISILSDIKIEINSLPGGNKIVIVSGAKGSLSQTIKPGVKIREENNCLYVDANNPNNKNMQGLYRSLIFNMQIGVSKGWHKALELKGVGFKASVNNDKLILNIGFSTPYEFLIPQGIKIDVAENKINLNGIDKQLVGETAARIRSLKPPEPYKGKGIRYLGEVVRKKAGKQAIKAGAA